DIRQQIASGIDTIIHLGRLRDGSRKVLEIVEILGYEADRIALKPLYQFTETGTDEEGRVCGNLQKRGELTYVEKLQYAGLW
ncbi:MAG: CpaF/VirB11 family protein, partial [Lachnospiraceae bacterium]|nr:CpaF/VirB11 family protein [Lachnospiraceae bacterium]